MADSEICSICGDDLAEGRYVICFYPWDEKWQILAHADPSVVCCKYCFDELRNDIYTRKGEND